MFYVTSEVTKDRAHTMYLIYNRICCTWEWNVYV